MPENDAVRIIVVLALVLGGLGCTSPNPKSCLDHHCSDPGLPFCDEDGSIAGTPGSCIAVACTAGQFQECRADKALTCNSRGDDFDLVECEFGCGTSGCNIASCPIGTTTMCSGSNLVACDGQGHVTNTEACALGCSDAAKRCNKVNPSNGLAGSFDEAATAADLTLSGAATIDTDAGTVMDTSGARAVLSSAITAGLPVGMFVLKVKSFTTGGNVTVVGTRALVIVAAGAVVINHVVSVSARTQINGPGSLVNDAACRGGVTASGNANGWAGGGGGGFGSVGGHGGTGGSPTIQGGLAGGVSGTTELVPLRGGCPGGRDATSSTDYTAGGGGGALQIVSGVKIELGDGGFLAANGSGGGKYKGIPLTCETGMPCDHGDGGGAGGAILLEAPLVTGSLLSGIVANGGAGACGQNTLAPSGGNSATPALGPTCSQDTNQGGDGATGTVAAQNGGNGANTVPVGGGGGGGAGRIRVNVPTAAAFTPGGVVSGVSTTGALGVR